MRHPEEEFSRIEYWLQSIISRTSSSPIVVIGNLFYLSPLHSHLLTPALSYPPTPALIIWEVSPILLQEPTVVIQCAQNNMWTTCWTKWSREFEVSPLYYLPSFFCSSSFFLLSQNLFCLHFTKGVKCTKFVQAFAVVDSLQGAGLETLRAKLISLALEQSCIFIYIV